jgi:NADH:ubiquinone oxidoreductase subunit 6 (subunit J)
VTTFLTVLLVIAMLGVVATLIAGVGGMVKGVNDPRRSNRLMQLRVLLQGVAIAIVAILLMMR